MSEPQGQGSRAQGSVWEGQHRNHPGEERRNWFYEAGTSLGSWDTRGADRELQAPRKSVGAGAQGDRLFRLPGVHGQEAQGD